MGQSWPVKDFGVPLSDLGSIGFRRSSESLIMQRSSVLFPIQFITNAHPFNNLVDRPDPGDFTTLTQTNRAIVLVFVNTAFLFPRMLCDQAKRPPEK
jgi:hypothetical protein